MLFKHANIIPIVRSFKSDGTALNAYKTPATKNGVQHKKNPHTTINNIFVTFTSLKNFLRTEFVFVRFNENSIFFTDSVFFTLKS